MANIRINNIIEFCDRILLKIENFKDRDINIVRNCKVYLERLNYDLENNLRELSNYDELMIDQAEEHLNFIENPYVDSDLDWTFNLKDNDRVESLIAGAPMIY